MDRAAKEPSNFRFLYDLEQPIEEKIEIIAKEVYGADGIDISPEAMVQIERYKAQVRDQNRSLPDVLLYGFVCYDR